MGVEAPAAGWRHAWTAPRGRLWLIACAVAAFLPIVGVPFRGWLDFSAFYAAGSLAFGPEVAQLEPIVRFQQAHGLPITPFVYPAGVALAYVPFAALPYGVAAALHAALMLGALVLAARIGADLLGLPRGWVLLGALAWGPAAAGILSGQNTSVALLLVVLGAAALARGREVAGGALVGLLAYKPQLAAPLFGTLLLRGRLAGVAVVAVALGVHYAAGVLATGGHLAWPADWIATVRAYGDADLRANGWQAVSLPGLGARLDLMLGTGFLALAGYVVGGLVVMACVPALRRSSVAEAVALACAAGLVVSPHAWVYDATLLLPAVGIFAARATRRGWPSRDRWTLAAAYAIGVTWPLGGLIGFTGLVVVVLAAPVVLLRDGTAEPAPV